MSCRNKSKQPANPRTRGHADIIAIDGPAGSGKSTVAKLLAKRLGYLYLDTGAMYRALTLKAIAGKVNFNNRAALLKLARESKIQLKGQGPGLKVILDGKNVSQAIRRQSVTEKVRFVARIKPVRAEMVKLQRKLANQSQGAVLEGRDIGTVVFPRARHKFYLDAQATERIRRRFKELKRMGQRVKLAELAAEIKKRDKNDMTRAAGPLVMADDAKYVDTTDLSVKEVVAQLQQRCYTELFVS